MSRKPGAIDGLLISAIAAILVYQSLYLFSYPQIDTGAWFGDESWTMLTLREVARSGVARIPEALGSSIASNNGFVNGVVWLSGAIYGVPALLFHGASPVAVGRVVTLLLSLALLFATYGLLRRINVSRTVSLAALVALVSANVFYFSSHSARLDTITALAVVLFLSAFVSLKDASGRRLFLTGFLVALSLTVYVHVPTLILLPWIFTLAYFRTPIQGWVLSLCGAAMASIVLGVLYVLSVGRLTLFGYGHNQYHAVVSALPILHPFSWQVQRINTIDRFIQVWGVAWPIVVIMGLGLILALVLRERFTPNQRLALVLSLLVLFSWTFFEGPAVFYEIHAAPIFTVIAAALLAVTEKYRTTIATVAIVLAALSLFQQRSFGDAGRTLSRNNDAAVTSLLSEIQSPGAPTVLADQPAWNIIAAAPGVQLMTTHLLLFGGEQGSVADILQRHNVKYLLLYATSHFQSPIRRIADSLYYVKDMRLGMLTDEAKPYDASVWSAPDTVRLYEVREMQ